MAFATLSTYEKGRLWIKLTDEKLESSDDGIAGGSEWVLMIPLGQHPATPLATRLLT